MRVDRAREERILDIVSKRPSISLADLIRLGDDKNAGRETPFTADDVYSLIAAGKVYFDRFRYLLADHEFVPLFIDREIAYAYEAAKDARPVDRMGAPNPFRVEPGAKFSWMERVWRISAMAEDKVFLLSLDGADREPLPRTVFEKMLDSHEIEPVDDVPEPDALLAKLTTISPEDAQVARRREIAVLRYLQGETAEQIGVKKRTLATWVAKYRFAERTWGFGYLGLVPAYGQRGNRFQIDPRVAELVDKVITEEYLKPTAPTIAAAYRILLEKCKEAGLECISEQALGERISRIPQSEHDLRRGGRRLAYGSKSPVWYLTDFNHSGDRPWDRVHIDCTQLDDFLVDSRTGLVLGKPWLTLAMDAYSRRVLAFCLSYEPPSYRRVLCIMREIVRRFHRLPDLVVTDNGKEFDNAYLQQFAGLYRITLEYRPKGAPRGGAMIERLFGTTNKMLVHNLVGNSRSLKNPRQTTKATDPRNLAKLTLRELHALLERFFYDFYDRRPHPALDGMSPRDKWLKGITMSGERPSRYVPDDEAFRISTLPTTRKGTCKVVPGKGIKIRHVWYWCNDFARPGVEGTEIPVKLEPWDISVAYAYIDGEWVQAISAYALILRNRSERQLMFATEEIRKAHAATKGRQEVHLGELVKLLQDGKGDMARIRREDAEDAEVRDPGAPKPSEPTSAPQKVPKAMRFGKSGAPEDVADLEDLK